jgi:capsular exopolysaccharide synthesis family protein
MTGTLKPQTAAAEGGVDFFLDGVVAVPHPVPIIDSLRENGSVAGEELRLLRANVRALAQERSIEILAVASALPGEGKSTIALGLAAALAREAGSSVLLIEADMRRPSISKTLSASPAPGLAEWLNGSLDRIPVRAVKPGNFHLLVAGQEPPERPENVGSLLMEALLVSARAVYDYVLLDCPPVLAVSDTILMQDLVDGLLMVVRSRLTPREGVLEALGRLRPDKVIGVVLNDHTEYRSSYRSYAYKSYGMADPDRGSNRPRSPSGKAPEARRAELPSTEKPSSPGGRQ